MAHLKKIITTTVLKKIPQDILLKKLDFIKDKLQLLEIWKEDNKLNFRELTHYLHEHCPKELEDFLCSFSQIAKPELYDNIVERLKSFGIEPSPLEDVETIAIKLAEKSIHACNVIAVRQMASESHTYTHYAPIKPHKVKPLTNEEISLLKDKVFSLYFEKKGRSKYIDVYSCTDENAMYGYVYYFISHGSPKTREYSVGESDELSVHSFRPELVDIVRINLHNGEISVYTKKTSSRELREFYVESFGRMILPDSKYLEHKKFDLEALKYCSIFNTRDVFFDTFIHSISLSQFSCLSHEGAKITVSKNVDDLYYKYLRNGYSITAITFNVVFTTDPKKKYKVAIHSPSRSEFPTGFNEHFIESYFEMKELIKKTQDEHDFELSRIVQGLSS